jgi:hypothetical protein
MDNSKSSYLIAIVQNSSDRTRWPRHYALAEASQPVVRKHMVSSLRSRNIGSVTSQRNVEGVAVSFRRPLVVGMAMRQSDHAERAALELLKNALGAPPGCCIDQYVTKQVDVEVMSGKT